MKLPSIVVMCFFLSACTEISSTEAVSTKSYPGQTPTPLARPSITSSTEAALASETAQTWVTAFPQVSSGTIAFISDSSGFRELWFLDITTGFTRKLTESSCPTDSSPYGRFQPGVQQFAWSPDGKQIAYLVACAYERASGIHVIDLDVGQDVSITKRADRYSYISWDPTGQRLLFSQGVLGQYGVYTIDLQSKNSPQDVSVTAVIQSDCYGGCLFASWSPDGEHIAFQGPRPRDIGVDRAYVSIVDIEGNPASYSSVDGRLPRDPEWIHDVSPGGFAWSHDGRYLVIATYKNYSDAYIRIAEVSNGAARMLPGFYSLQSSNSRPSQFGPGFHTPFFSRDDETLYFVSLQPNATDPLDPYGRIYRAKFKDSPTQAYAVEAISPEDQLAGFPSLSGDGNWLVYAVRTGKFIEIWIQSTDGKFRQRLAGGNFENTQPAWRPSRN